MLYAVSLAAQAVSVAVGSTLPFLMYPLLLKLILPRLNDLDLAIAIREMLALAACLGWLFGWLAARLRRQRWAILLVVIGKIALGAGLWVETNELWGGALETHLALAGVYGVGTFLLAFDQISLSCWLSRVAAHPATWPTLLAVFFLGNVVGWFGYFLVVEPNFILLQQMVFVALGLLATGALEMVVLANLLWMDGRLPAAEGAGGQAPAPPTLRRGR